MNFKTLSDLNNDIYSNISNLPKIDVIVGVPRSGMLVASILSLYMNKPLTDIDSLRNGILFSSGDTKNTIGNIKSLSEAKNVLVVEDSVTTGNSIRKAKEKLRDLETKYNLIYFAAYVTHESKKHVNLYLSIVEHPRSFEWNIMHTGNLTKACVDIDGVLCVDPTNEQNDGGSIYKQFLENAIPKLVPTVKINTIVTSRLEKYRPETEKWLAKHNIEYDKLYMLPLNSKEERQRLGCHGEYKAKIYKKSKCILFVESNPEQAIEINKLTKKGVFCIDNQEYYDESRLTKTKANSYSRIRSKIPRKVKLILRKIIKK